MKNCEKNSTKIIEIKFKKLAKGEIARFEQFLLLSQCFQKLSAAEVSESVYMWEGLTLSHFKMHFDTSAADDL